MTNVWKHITNEKLVELYQSGQSLEAIARIHKMDPNRLSKVLKQLGLIIVNRQNERGTHHSIFGNIDSTEKAYWLGFLYADGSIHSTTNQISLALKLSDIDHVAKFKKFIGAENRIYLTEVSCRYCFYSSQIRGDLIRLGCIPRKSEVLMFPSILQVSEKFHLDFIRGYFDGDGCLTMVKRNYGYRPIIKFIGTENVLIGINNILGLPKRNLWLANSSKNASKYVFESGYSCSDSVIILEKLYENASVYLDRKYKRYCIFKEHNFGVQQRNLLDYQSGKSVKAKSKDMLIPRGA